MMWSEPGKGKTHDLVEALNKVSNKKDKEFLKDTILKKGLPLKINYFAISLDTIEELKSSKIKVDSKQELVTEWDGKKPVKGFLTYLILNK